ncbi:saccharopine dehydrogenase family protein [Helicobacter pullorum]|uniref:saccharopine dehydrogenase family protein n=1 Tax=Helicobacter pullorum TaxID=35818 RepID=UPI0009811ADE|nr:saccharopine dehydrogenase family protein [Helicobacter pullorum]
MACVLQIGAGGVGGVVAHKMAMNREVFSRIVLASRNIAKCAAIADSIRAKGLGEIEIDSVDADNVDEIVALIEKYKPFLVVNVALPYQDLSIMQACLQTKTHYLDTANYEHPDSAHFEYKEQWAYDTRYKQAGIFALLGSGFDPGVTNVFCAYAQKHYFDEIHTIDILDCNAGDHGYAFATNFNPEINLREVSSKARFWTKDDKLALNQDLKKDAIYRKFEREEKHFKLESNTQDLKNESYFGGQWRDVAPLALMKEWEYPEVGVKNSYLLYHEELESLIRNIKGLKRIRFFMTFGESYLTHMKCLENVGLLRVDEVEHNGQKIVPIQVLKTLLPDPASLAPRTKGQTHIGCYIKGVKDGKERTIYIYNICEHEACYKEVNAQGVSYTTGVPAMIGAKLICEGKWGVGAVKNSSLGGHSVLSDKSGNLHSDFRSFASSKLPQSSLDNPLFSSQSLECQQGADSKTRQSLTQDARIAESSYTQERLALNADMPQGGEYQGIDNATELQNLARTNEYSQSGNAAGLSMNFEGCQARSEGSLVSLNDQAECDDSLKSRDKTTQGAGVWNMEQNDPDPFMQELNKQGLPYVVLEIDSNGDSKVLEDGRK